MRWRSIGMALIGAAAVAGLVWVAIRPQPVPVDVVAVARGPMQITIGADGKTRIRDVFVVAAPITGTAERSPVKVGDRVVKDRTVVAVVRPAAPPLLDARSRLQAQAAVEEAKAALAAASARVRQAREELDYAESEYQRTKKLVERGVAAITQLENAEKLRALRKAALETALSEEERAKSALARAEAALVEPDTVDGDAGDGACCADCCVRMLAPADGVVLEVTEISSRPVQAGARLLAVGDPQNLEIVADLLSADAVRVPPRARALVERWGGPGVLEARLRRIAPVARTKVSALGIEEQRVDAIFDFVTEPQARAGLGHGFAVYLRIVAWEAQDVLQLPLSAVFREGDGWFAFAVEAGRAHRVAVRLGRRNDETAELIGGLGEGAKVIVHPGDRIRDGVQVVDRSGR